MAALLWIFALLLNYAAATFWLAHIFSSFRRGSRGRAGALIAAGVAAACIDVLAPPAGRLWIFPSALAVLTAVIALSASPRPALFPERDGKAALLHLVLISGSALFLLPFFWMISTSLKPDLEMAAYPPVWIPHSSWSNYPRSLQYLPSSSRDGLVNLYNTLVYAIMAMIGMVLSSSLVAYGFARLRWPGRDWVFGIVLATMMLPPAVTMMPQFLIFRDLHWIDTLLPLWVPNFFAAPFNIFLLRQFFMGIPQEMEDAAKIDGCSPLATWWKVMLPMVRPAMAAVSIMTFLGAWKDFLGPLIYISSPSRMPLSYLLELYNSSNGGEPGMLMAATTMVMLPIIVLFFFTQKYFIEGVTLSGLGGR